MSRGIYQGYLKARIYDPGNSDERLVDRFLARFAVNSRVVR
ncbi:MAG: hypothetical protein O2945_22320 [Planctomycetota bacterium]|nr:hypothetical protein [Planctomycetota bacterium]MDA0921811.1 hypothetical protein [Planctomycetota bacterium]